MKTKDIQELYKIKLHNMDTILHQISLMDQVENEQELSEIMHSLLQAIGNYTGQTGYMFLTGKPIRRTV